ncbi:MAG: T9SS type A sorting domain-containing protein [Flavobacteriales bacterium]|nr:T9SS type A sorting domain-containing protein [Flavobacteriales bacterium]
MRTPILTIAVVACTLAATAQFHIVPVLDAGENPRDLNRDPEFSIYMIDSGWVQHLDQNATDAWTPPIALPFPVAFNGSSFTSFQANQSGVLTFTPNPWVQPAETNYALPSAQLPNNSVCVWGLYFNHGGSGLYTKTFGTTPHRQFWATWCFASSDDISFTYWSIAFEETTGHIYIADQKTGGAPDVTSLTVGVQVSATEAYQVPTSPNVANVTGAAYNVDFADNGYYVIKPGTTHSLDAFTEQEATTAYAQVGSAIPLRAEVRNLGTQTITDLMMHYRVDGGAVQSANALMFAPLATGAMGVLEHPQLCTFNTAGTHNIDLWCNAPNGGIDQWPANDTIHFTIAVEDTFVVRTTLFEMFTSSSCGPCVSANTQLDSVILPQVDNYCLIKYQQSYPAPGDPYFIPTASTRAGHYGVNGIPQLMIDATEISLQFFTVDDVADHQDIPSFMSMDIVDATFTGTLVTGSVEIEVLKDLPQTDLRLQIAIVEKLTTGNVSTNGETEFHHVMMKMLPSASGLIIGALSNGQSLSFSINTGMAGTFVEEMDDLAIVAWVEEIMPKRILQSACADVMGAVGISGIEDGAQLRVLPIPTNGPFTVIVPADLLRDSPRLVLFDAQSRAIWTTTQLSERTLVDVAVAPGVYTVVVTSGNGQRSARVIVGR